jgi:hypothetical protein
MAQHPFGKAKAALLTMKSEPATLALAALALGGKGKKKNKKVGNASVTNALLKKATHAATPYETQVLSKTGKRLELNNAIKLLCKSKETEIKYLLFNLNNLIKKIESIINLININETFLKKIEKINNNINRNIKIKYLINKIRLKKKNFKLELENNITHTNNSNNLNKDSLPKLNKSACATLNTVAAPTTPAPAPAPAPATAPLNKEHLFIENDSYQIRESLILSDNYNKTDLYLKISNGLNYESDDNNSIIKAVPENIIKIEKTIKTISNHDNHYYNDNYSNNNNNNYPSLKDKGIYTKNFDFKKDPVSINSNPVNILYFNNNMNKPIINQYLKSMSIFNTISKGSIMYFSNIIGYNFHNKNLRPELRTQNIYKLLYSSFRSMYCLISKPVFIIKSNKIIIQLFYFLLIPRIFKYKKKYSYTKKRKRNVFSNNRSNFFKGLRNKFKYNTIKNKLQHRDSAWQSNSSNNLNFKLNQNLLKKIIIKKSDSKRNKFIKLNKINLINLYPLKFKKLAEVLNNFFKKPVELDLIRLHYPYNDTNILVRLLAFMINKIKIRRITRKLFRNAVIKSINKNYNKDKTNIIPAFLSGLTIKVAGRLMRYKVIPRKTVKIVRRGSSSIGKVNYTDISRYTNKNRRGAFTIFIKSGQNFF